MGVLADAVAAAVQGDPAEGEGTGITPEATPETVTAPSSTGEQVPASTEPAAVEGEATPEGEGTPEPAGEWFGVSLEGVPAEVVQRLEEQNKFIQKLLREKPEQSEEVVQFQQPQSTPEPEPELTDEDIMRALGLDPEDPYDEHTARVAVPLVQRMVELEEKVTSLSTTTQAEQTQRYWESTLNAMEKEFGSLGVDRDRVYEFAIEESIADPKDAYWRIAGPTRVALWQELQKRTTEMAADDKRSATGTRPRASAPTVEAALTSTDTKSAVAEAARIIAAERGFEIS